MNQKPPPFVFLAVVITFVTVNLVLTRSAWFFEGDGPILCIAFFCGQTSLGSLVGCNRRLPAIARFAVPLVVAAASWFAMSQVLPWGIGEPASAAWAIVLLIQVVTVVAAVGGLRIGRDAVVRLAESSSEGSVQRPLNFTFGIRTMILWTATFALVLGFIQFGRNTWNWNDDVVDFPFLKALPLLAWFNAVVAVTWAVALQTADRRAASSWRSQSINVILAVTMLYVGSHLLPRLTEWASGMSSVSVHEAQLLAGVQSVTIVLPILAVNLSRRGNMPQQ